MNSIIKFLKSGAGFILRPTHSRTMGLLVVLVLVAAVSLTVIVAQQQQETRQRASGLDCTPPFKAGSACGHGGACGDSSLILCADSQMCVKNSSDCQAFSPTLTPTNISTPTPRIPTPTTYLSYSNPEGWPPALTPTPALSSANDAIGRLTPFPTPTPFNCEYQSQSQGLKYQCWSGNSCPTNWLASKYNDKATGAPCGQNITCCFYNPPEAPAVSEEQLPLAPTPTSVTAAVTIPSDSCASPYKIKGDANCDGRIDILDFNIWRDEFNHAIYTTRANFSGDEKDRQERGDIIIDILDFNIWRNSMQDNSLPH